MIGDPTKHQLYRLYSCDDTLLYVGLNSNGNPRSRYRSHQKTQWWADQISYSTARSYQTNGDLIRAEKQAIIDEKPLYNVIHNDGVPRNLTKEEFLARGGVLPMNNKPKAPEWTVTGFEIEAPVRGGGKGSEPIIEARWGLRKDGSLTITMGIIRKALKPDCERVKMIFKSDGTEVAIRESVPGDTNTYKLRTTGDQKSSRYRYREILIPARLHPFDPNSLRKAHTSQNEPSEYPGYIVIKVPSSFELKKKKPNLKVVEDE